MKILDALPFLGENSMIESPKGPVTIYAYQIVLWVTLTVGKCASRPFPAVLDTGLNRDFALTEQHLVDWLDIRPESMRQVATTRIRGQNYPVKAGSLSIHRNVRDSTVLKAVHPYPLNNIEGVLVIRGGEWPRLPVLGLRAIVNNDLQLIVDGKTMTVTLRDRRWF